MIEIGFGIATITPPLGTPLGGYENRKFHASGIHDDLHARCVLLKDPASGLHVAIIACELLWVNYRFSDSVKAIVEEITRGVVKKEHVIIHAIHTHASQRIEGGLDFYYKPVRRKDDIDRGWYLEHGVPYLQRAIASSVHGALLDLAPAFARAASIESTVGHNRRAGDEAAVVVDRELLVIDVQDNETPGSTTRALLYNLALHCVAMGEANYLVSADWPFFTGQVLRQVMHLPRMAPVIFFQGTAGNTNPYNCRFGSETREPRDALAVGQQVAAGIITAAREDLLRPVLDARSSGLRIDTRTIHVEVTDPAKKAFYTEFNLWWIGVERGDDDALVLSIRITMVRAGRLLFIAVPGEPFGEFGVKIKRLVHEHDPGLVPVVMELTDGAVGYIPTRGSYHGKGGYEASLAGSADTGDAILDAVAGMLRDA